MSTVSSQATEAGSPTARRLLVGGLLLLLVGSLGTWLATRERLPPVVRLATAAPGGLYHHLAAAIAPRLGERLGRPVELVVSRGSVENHRLLTTGGAHLAILEAGLVELDELAIVAPLYRDLTHVVVRCDAGIESLADLAGRNVVLGPPGSGMRENALAVLRHYRVDAAGLGETERYFSDLAEDPSLEAALVTTGLLNPDLTRLLAAGEHALLPIPEAEALSLREPAFRPGRIPRGLYSTSPAVPPEDVTTVGITSVLAAPKDVPSRLVEATQEVLYDDHVRRQVPVLLSRREAAGWDEYPTHPATRSFFQPFGGLQALAALMESLAALKELLFALGAGLYLAWLRWNRLRQRRLRDLLQAQKDRLDQYLEETIAVERAQIQTTEAARLRGYLDRVTDIKLRALDELTHEALRGDVNFAIFLQQCHNLSRKIQGKLQVELMGAHYPEAAAGEGPDEAVAAPPPTAGVSTSRD